MNLPLVFLLCVLSGLLGIAITWVYWQRKYKLQTLFMQNQLELAQTKLKTLEIDLATNKRELSLWIQRYKDEQQKYAVNNTMLNLLHPLSNTVEKIEHKLELLKQETTKQDSKVDQQIKQVMLSNQETLKTTRQIHNTLRNAKTRGVWGEIALQRVLELSGLTQYIDYVQQSSFQQDGKGYCPDVIVKLPDKHEIIIDAKTPMDAYLQASTLTESADSKQRELLLKNHASQIRIMINDLAKKNYHSQQTQFADFTVMFIPADSVLSTALETDPTLLEHALKQKVCLASPSSLLAILRTVQSVWTLANVQNNTQDILQLGKEFVTRVSKVIEYINKIGANLDSLCQNYHNLTSSFESRILVTVRKLQVAENTSLDLATTSTFNTTKRIKLPELDDNDEKLHI